MSQLRKINERRDASLFGKLAGSKLTKILKENSRVFEIRESTLNEFKHYIV
jgi:hypothetical protein